MIRYPFGVLMRVLIPFVLVGSLLVAGCQTDPASEIGPNEAKLNGTAACPGAGANGHVWYQVSANGGAFTDATSKRRFECSAKTDEVPIPDTATNLAPGTGYQFRMVVQFDDGNVSHWDSAGTQNGTAYDGFSTPAEPIVDVVEFGAHSAATNASLPSHAVRSRARQSAESFWRAKGKLTSCMAKASVRWLRVGESIKVPHRSGESKLTMKKKIRGIGVGCNAPSGYDRGPGLIILNRSVSWPAGDLCAAYKHELGHLRGFYHSDGAKEPIMNSPVPFPMRVC